MGKVSRWLRDFALNPATTLDEAKSLQKAADTIDRLTRERDEAYTAGFEAAREEAAKVADSMTNEIKRLHATDYSHVKIGSLTAVSSAIADAIRSLSPSKDEEQTAGRSA